MRELELYQNKIYGKLILMCSTKPRTPAEIGDLLNRDRSTITRQLKNLEKEKLITQDKQKKYFVNLEQLIQEWRRKITDLKTEDDKDNFESFVEASYDILIDRYSVMEKTLYKGIEPTIESLGYFMLNQQAFFQDGPREYATRLMTTPTADVFMEIAKEYQTRHPKLMRNTKRALKKGKVKIK